MTGHYLSESYEREGENNKKYPQNIHVTIFSITERKILPYRFFFSISDENLLRGQAGVENYFLCSLLVFFLRIALKKGPSIINNLSTSVWLLQGNLRPCLSALVY